MPVTTVTALSLKRGWRQTAARIILCFHLCQNVTAFDCAMLHSSVVSVLSALRAEVEAVDECTHYHGD